MNQNRPDGCISELVIVGGGTAGWMTAAALSKILNHSIAITLVESDEIGTVGVGEATIPMIQLFNQVVGIDENEFMRETQASFKLGIEFVNWGRLGDRYIHAFGNFGQEAWTVDFYQYWLRLWLEQKAFDLEAYSINRMACKAGRCMRADPQRPNSPLGQIVHAFHFDAGLYAKYLRKLAESRGVKRIEGMIEAVEQEPHQGHIKSVKLGSGQVIAGDFFIDCTGFRGLLIEQSLKTGYEDWSQWLPANRAIAVPCERSSDFTPYTRATAQRVGWQWRIPLQHRTGNGIVYSSNFLSDDEARSILLSNLDGRPTAEPRPLRFVTGKRKKLWHRNVLAIGLSSGFLEPLESTSIHLIQSTIAKFISFFPDRHLDPADIEAFNRQMDFEFSTIRDFIILHYKLNQRDDSAFWKHCATMPIPERLQEKIDLYQSHGRIIRESNELFSELAWLQVMHGQGLKARRAHPLASIYSEKEVSEFLEHIRQTIANCVDLIPTHADYINQHCKSMVQVAA